MGLGSWTYTSGDLWLSGSSVSGKFTEIEVLLLPSKS